MTKLEFDAKVLEAVPLFSGLPRGDLEDIVRLGQKVSFDAGVDIVQSGTPAMACIFSLRDGPRWTLAAAFTAWGRETSSVKWRCSA